MADRPDVVVLDGDDDASDDFALDPGPDHAPVAPDLTVGRGVIVEVARLAALEVPEVLRVARRGPPWRAYLAGPPIMVRVRAEGVSVKLRIIARPGSDLAETGRLVRDAVGRAVERLLGLEVREVTVLVDGVGS
ncbi:MAG TPA: Asp23/Gls24 family envelope stress response protein [Candidatus Limnocylindria bacterium]|nr:Asp23/Gls24 family envelope stress response protein [Candidatus Limnocylindria bacterium]